MFNFLSFIESYQTSSQTPPNYEQISRKLIYSHNFSPPPSYTSDSFESLPYKKPLIEKIKVDFQNFMNTVHKVSSIKIEDNAGSVLLNVPSAKTSIEQLSTELGIPITSPSPNSSQLSFEQLKQAPFSTTMNIKLGFLK